MPFLRIVLTLFSVAPLWLTMPSAAHEGRPVYLEVTQEAPDTYRLRWKIPPVLEVGHEPKIQLSGGGCKLVAGQTHPSLMGSQLYRCSGQATDMRIDLHYAGANPVLSTLLLLRTQDGNTQSIMASPNETSLSLPVTETFWQVAKRYTVAGTDHILAGYDHLLFVFLLMLLSASLHRILITVTGFTLGHSVTLAVSALWGWSLPPTLVEPLIAFSILILAVEVTKGSHTTLAYRYPAIIATSFGLLHGFGFGGALAEIGLPYGLQIQALAFFNIGVELGQLLFVIVAYGLYLLALRALHAVKAGINAAAFKPLALYPAGIIAAYWTFDRLAGAWM